MGRFAGLDIGGYPHRLSNPKRLLTPGPEKEEENCTSTNEDEKRKKSITFCCGCRPFPSNERLTSHERGGASLSPAERKKESLS